MSIQVDMVSTRSKCEEPQKKTLDIEQCLPLKTLISAIEAPEGLKAPPLKSLYFLLVHLSSNQQFCLGKGVEMNELVMEFGEDKVRIILKDICRLSDILFRELHNRLKKLLSAVHDVFASMSLQLPWTHPEMWAAIEELNLLLRCCMVILTLPVPQEHIVENGRVLLMIFKQLSLLELPGGCDRSRIDVKNLLLRQCTYSGKGYSASVTEQNGASLSFLELPNPCIPILSTILEVLIDELLVHGQLGKYFQIIDSLSPPTERLFMHNSNPGDIVIVMEVISTYFLLSISNERAIQDFLNGLTWVHGKNFKAPELSPTAAISLLLNPVVLSSPNIVQAHMISLVSDAISFGAGYESLKPDLRLIDCYLSAFKSSVILYTQHMVRLQTESDCVGVRGSIKSNISGNSFQPSFDSYIDPSKRKKLDHLMNELNDSWGSHLRSMFSKMKSELVTSSIAYIKESQNILDIACRYEILSFLTFILSRAANDVNDIALPLNGDTSLQDICLLASLLKLMSNSLTRAIWCLRHTGDLHCLETLKNLSSCKEYDFIVGIITCFKEFNIRLPIQTSLHNMMETHSMKHKESTLMLLHFLGLLSLSYVSGLDFLVKNCLSIIMALTNLFVFEEGNVDALSSFARSRSFPSGRPLANLQEALVSQNSSLVVASKFQKIQTLYSSMASVAINSTRVDNVATENLSSVLVDNVEQGVVIKDETCSGEIFLKTVLQGSEKLPDFDELCDFIECKKGKNYFGWLRDREKYRNQKLEKRAKRRLEKKKKAWKSIEGKKAWICSTV